MTGPKYHRRLCVCGNLALQDLTTCYSCTYRKPEGNAIRGYTDTTIKRLPNVGICEKHRKRGCQACRAIGK